MSAAPLASLAAYFATLSLMAIGGANAVLPDMHRHAVEVQAWMTSDEFAGLVALSQAAPGPNVLIVALIGWKAYGLPGGLTAIHAIFDQFITDMRQLSAERFYVASEEAVIPSDEETPEGNAAGE